MWPLLFWALAHTRPFVMSILDLVGISKLASSYMEKNKKTKKTLLYYIVFIIGVALARGYSAYGLGLSAPLVGPIAWAHQPFEVAWYLRLLVT